MNDHCLNIIDEFPIITESPTRIILNLKNKHKEKDGKIYFLQGQVDKKLQLLLSAQQLAEQLQQQLIDKEKDLNELRNEYLISKNVHKQTVGQLKLLEYQVTKKNHNSTSSSIQKSIDNTTYSTPARESFLLHYNRTRSIFSNLQVSNKRPCVNFHKLIPIDHEFSLENLPIQHEMLSSQNSLFSKCDAFSLKVLFDKVSLASSATSKCNESTSSSSIQSVDETSGMESFISHDSMNPSVTKITTEYLQADQDDLLNGSDFHNISLSESSEFSGYHSLEYSFSISQLINYPTENNNCDWNALFSSPQKGTRNHQKVKDESKRFEEKERNNGLSEKSKIVKEKVFQIEDKFFEKLDINRFHYANERIRFDLNLFNQSLLNSQSKSVNY